MVLEDFQIRYLLDDSPLKVTNKTRQAGASLVVSMAKFFRAYTNPTYRCDIVSINLRESVDKIRYIRNLHDTLPEKYRVPLTVDNALSIGFHRGSRKSIVTSIASSGAVRGGKKELVFDEFAHYFPRGKDQDLFFAAAPAIINGDLALDIISTPNGKGNMFERIFTNMADVDGTKPFDLFSRHEFIWLDVRRFVKEGKFDELQYRWYSEYKKDKTRMRELVEEFGSDRLLFFYKIFPWSMFQQEFCGEFVTDQGAFISWDTIRSCIRGAVGTASDGVKEYFEESLVPWTDGRPKNNNNSVYMGVDFGQSGEDDDKTSIQVFERDSKGRLLHRHCEFLDKKDFPDFPSQADHIVRRIREFRPARIGADNTGLGIGVIALILEREPTAPIERIHFSSNTKEEMAFNVKTLMQDEKVWLLEKGVAVETLHGEIAGMRRETTVLGTPQYYGSPHDDGFWAMAMALQVGKRRESFIYTLDSALPSPFDF